MRIFSPILLCVLLLGCTAPQPRQRANAKYLHEIQTWQQQRLQSLKSPTGWLNLAGLFWLKAGENTAGADSTNTLIFPKTQAPNFIGSFILEDTVVTFRAHPNVAVTLNDSIISSVTIQNETAKNPPTLALGTLSWTIIKRGDKYGVRLRDHEHPLLKQFAGIETFPVDSSWRLEARFEANHPPKLIAVPTILNTIIEEPSPGAFIFNVAGKTYRLDATGKMTDKELFVIFADRTNGKETYGAGRFLYVPTPNLAGNAVLDFNKAYNPPCAFTPYATCPLPPEQNTLPIRITAGEKNYIAAKH